MFVSKDLIKRRWLAARALTLYGWWTVARATLLAPLLVVSLRLCSFNSVFTVLSRLTPTPLDEPPTDDSAQVQQVARAVQIAAFVSPLNVTCLPRSLALWYYLRQQRLDAQLRLGVRNDSGPFSAHAWVEYRGQALIDTEQQLRHFSKFDIPIDPGR